MSVKAQSRGFTLVELLAVIAIIGVLAALVLAVVPNMRLKADLAAGTSNLRTVVSAMNVYAADNARAYPSYANSTGTNQETWRCYLLWKGGYVTDLSVFTNPVNMKNGTGRGVGQGAFDGKGDCYFSAARVVYTEWKISPKNEATPNRVTDDPNVPIVWDQRADQANLNLNHVTGPSGQPAGLFGYIDGSVALRYAPDTPVR